MQIETTAIEGLIILEPTVYTDERGYFFESFNERKFEEKTGLKIDWKQDNESYSHKGALRGLHYQIAPYAQDKLVRVAAGAVYDVVVDLRKNSSTFGKSFGIELSAKNKKQLFVPQGFAHGFQVLEDDTLFVYKCSNFYSSEHDRSLFWNDQMLEIDWPIKKALLSEKDKSAPGFKDIEIKF